MIKHPEKTEEKEKEKIDQSSEENVKEIKEITEAEATDAIPENISKAPKGHENDEINEIEFAIPEMQNAKPIEFDLHEDMTFSDLTERDFRIIQALHEVKIALHHGFALMPPEPLPERSEVKQKAFVDKCLFYKNNPGGSPQLNHEYWSDKMKKAEWKVGEEYSIEEKTHPSLKDFCSLPPIVQKLNNIFAIVADQFWGE